MILTLPLNYSTNHSPMKKWASPEDDFPPKAQLEEWLDRDEGVSMTSDDAVKYIKKKSKELKGDK